MNGNDANLDDARTYWPLTSALSNLEIRVAVIPAQAGIQIVALDSRCAGMTNPKTKV